MSPFQADFQVNTKELLQQSWLPLKIAICVQDNDVMIEELSIDSWNSAVAREGDWSYYELTATIIQVLDDYQHSKKSHFVAHIRGKVGMRLDFMLIKADSADGKRRNSRVSGLSN